MSRTFELLQRVEKEQEPVPAPLAVSPVARTLDEDFHARLERMGEEEVVKLVQSVFRSDAEHAPHVVVFTGVGHGDGCSWICSSAGLTLASQTLGSVCMVDANLRTPSLHRYFDLENRYGLAEAITHSGPVRSFAQQVGKSNLWILTSGSLALQSPAAPLSSEALRARVTELRSEFDHVLIDVPPANLYTDAVSIGRLSDGVVLVLQSNATRKETALKVKESFETAGVRLLGAVLNKRTFPIPQALYERL